MTSHRPDVRGLNIFISFAKSVFEPVVTNASYEPTRAPDALTNVALPREQLRGKEEFDEANAA